jgi:sulfide dehydrogenase cytochrome subunit
MTAPRFTAAALFDAGSRAAAKFRGVANASSVRRIIALAIAVSLVVLIADRGTAAQDERGAQLAAVCASCHRLDGRDKGIPSIVGMDKEKFAGAMAAFKSGDRSSQIMHAVALSLSDDEIVMLAEYLAAQPRETKRR